MPMNPVLRLAAPAPFELWSVDLAVVPTADALNSLSDDERARAARFVFEHDRRRFLAAHAALRQRLAARTGVAAAALRFVVGPFGKPGLDGVRCSFNLSHSQDLALIVMAPDGEIGVDVECLRPVPDAHALAEQHYTAAERAALHGAGPLGRDRAFLMGWTRKEACLKAIGSGLSVEALAVDAGLHGERRVVLVETGCARVSVEVESLPGNAGWVGALARVHRAGP